MQDFRLCLGYRRPMFARRKNQLWVRAGSEVMAVGSSVASGPAGRAATPLLGLRRKPGRLALAVFRLPLPLYRRGWGGLLGHTFLVLVHAGRKTGKPRSAVAMVLRYDRQTHEAVICSGWGPGADWIRNIRVRPALQVQIGRESFTPQQRFLSEEESLAVVAEFGRRHPGRLRLITSILGWGDLRSDAAARDFVSTRPFVSFRPADPSRASTGGRGGATTC
jgi:deazaflavin-dependent oxidoreductase (nitroreductase family)